MNAHMWASPSPGRTYKQGDICPACTYRDQLMDDNGWKWKERTKCHHTLKITK